MLRILGILTGLGAVYSLISGAILAISKPVLEASDSLLIGIALMVVSQLLIKAADTFDSKTKE